MNIKEYVDEYEKIVSEMIDRRYMIPDTKVVIAILKERGKDRRMSELSEERQAKLVEPITDRQKKYIKDLCTTKMRPIPDFSRMSKESAGKFIFDLKKF